MPSRHQEIHRGKISHWLALIWILGSAALLLAGLTAVHWRTVHSRNANSQIVAQLGPHGYLAQEVLRFAKNAWQDRRLARKDVTALLDFLESRNPPLKESASRGNTDFQHEGDLPNVIYLQLESVDGFSILARHRGQPVMPFLKSLSGRSLFFPFTKDVTSSGRTVDGELLALASIPPLIGKPVYPLYDLSLVPSLPRQLQMAGYRTISIHGFHGYFWNRRVSHQRLGFEESFFLEDLDRSEWLGWGISDKSVLEQAVSILSAHEDPVFAHIILLSNHHPYHYVGRTKKLPTGDLVLDHITSLRYVDEAVRIFFEKLEETGLLENTIIAVFSDHDSAIQRRLLPALELPDPPLLARSVPMMITGMRHAPGKFDKLSTLADLPVLLLEYLGLEIPPTFTGNGLFADNPVLLPSGELAWKEGNNVLRQDAPIAASTLTRMAILHPERVRPNP